MRGIRILVVSTLAVAMIGLTAHQASAAHNDLFANAERITGSVAHSTLGATPNQTGEPAPCGAINRTVWYRYTPASSGTLIVNTFGSGFDTVLAAYGPGGGSTPNELTTVALKACNDDIDGVQSLILFAAAANTTYFIQVGGFSGATGFLDLNFSGPAAGIPPSIDDLSDATVIAIPSSAMGSTEGAGVEPNERRPCGLVAATAWYDYTAPSSGPVRFDTFGSTFDTVLAAYTGAMGSLTDVACNDDFGGLQSRIDFNATSGTVYRIAVGGFSASTGSYTLTASGPPTAPQNLTAQPGSAVGSITLAWQLPASNGGQPLTSQQIFRNNVQVATVALSATSYTDTGLAPLSNNTYEVRAVNSVGAGPKSNSACNKPFPWVGALGCV